MEWKKPCAIALGSLVLVGLGGLAGAYVKDPVIKTEKVEVEVEKEIEKLVPVELSDEDKATFVDDFLKENGLDREGLEQLKVDSENLDMVLDHLIDNNGNVEYLTDGLDDDEADKIAARIDTMNNIKNKAIEAVEEDGIDELDDEFVEGIELDDDDIERFKVEKDHDDLIVDDYDFDYNDFEILVPAHFEQDDVEYDAVFRVIFKDGEVDKVELEKVKEAE